MGACQSHACNTNSNQTAQRHEQLTQHKKPVLNTNLNTNINTSFDTKRLVVPSPSNKNNKAQVFNFTKQSLFFPHNYNLFTKEDIAFYNNIINIKNSILPTTPVSNIYELKSLLEEHIVDTEKKKLTYCWKLFKWITNNIRPTNEDDKKSDIIDRRCGSSQSIANLFQNILNIFNIECLIISGIIKSPNNISERYYWNAVKLAGQYRLVDCCSAYKNKYGDFYFCSPPHHLIYTHYPDNKDYMFLNQSSFLIDKTIFDNLPLFTRFYFIYGFQLLDNKYTNIKYSELKHKSDEFHFTFCLPDRLEPNLKLLINDSYADEKLIYITSRRFEVHEDNKKLNLLDYYFYYENILFNTDYYENFTDILNSFIVYDVHIKLPIKAKYVIEVYSDKDENEEKDYKYCYAYNLEIDNDNYKEHNMESMFYPKVSDTFVKKQCEIIEPRDYNLKHLKDKQKNIGISIRIPNANSVAVFYDDNDEFLLLQRRDDDIWYLNHNYEKNVKNLVIAASFEECEEFGILVSYIFN
jgi:hypothetical protein